MEFFDNEVIDYRLFTPEYFEKKYKGLPDETYEFMAVTPSYYRISNLVSC